MIYLPAGIRHLEQGIVNTAHNNIFLLADATVRFE